MNCKLYLNNSLSELSFDNEFLYSKNYITIIKEFLKEFNIEDWKYKSLENCYNTNIDLLGVWYSYFKKSTNGKTKIAQLNIKKNYYDLVVSTSTARINSESYNMDSVYIKSKNSAVNYRIENKSSEVTIKLDRGFRDKQYILNKYSRILDISTDIYRLEQSINFSELRSACKSDYYVQFDKKGKVQDVLTPKKYDNLSNDDKELFILCSKQLKRFDLNLLDNQDFLSCLFREFRTFEIDKIIDISSNFNYNFYDYIPFNYQLYSGKKTKIYYDIPKESLMTYLFN
jgi:hypothetical protein